MSFPVSRVKLPLATAAAMAMFAVTAHAAPSDATITEAAIKAGKLVISGTAAQANMRLRLDGKPGSDFNAVSKADRSFSFSLVYLPKDCIVDLQKVLPTGRLGGSNELVVANCAPAGISPRGDWSAGLVYETNDLVANDGSSWLAKRDNVNEKPGEGANWQLFAAKGEAGDAGATGNTASATAASSVAAVQSSIFASRQMRAAPTGPAGGDLSGVYPNPVLRNSAVTAAKINNRAVTGTKIAQGAVGEVQLRDLGVTTPKIADAAVTETKVADGAITGAKIASESITNAQLATDSVQATEIADNSIDAGEIVDFGLTNEDVGVLFAQVNADGSVFNSSGGVTSTSLGTGLYEVTFGVNISNCAFVATQGEGGIGGAGGAIMGVTDRSGNPNAVFATARTNANAPVNTAFQLVVVC